MYFREFRRKKTIFYWKKNVLWRKLIAKKSNLQKYVRKISKQMKRRKMSCWQFKLNVSHASPWKMTDIIHVNNIQLSYSHKRTLWKRHCRYCVTVRLYCDVIFIVKPMCAFHVNKTLMCWNKISEDRKKQN